MNEVYLCGNFMLDFQQLIKPMTSNENTSKSLQFSFSESFFQQQEKQNQRMNLMAQIMRSPVFREFQQKTKSIDQIARLALNQREKCITEKYRNIQSSAKILKSLIVDFTKKSIKFEEQLREISRIEELKYQTDYHSRRLQICINLSSNLQSSISHKKEDIQKYEAELRKYKEQLIIVKTENLKKILKIEMLQKMEKEKQEKQRKDMKRATKKQKMYENRVQMHTGLTYTPSTVDLLKKQKQDLSILLWQKINKKLTISDYLFNNYKFMKEKLIKQQKKSNLAGLNGSLFFKLQENGKLSNTIGLSIPRKNKSDHKLLIYDVLKQKHSNEIKAEQKHDNEIVVQYEKFMKFTPIQLLGLIQLKGGVDFLRRNGVQFFSDVKKQDHQKIVKNAKKQVKAIKYTPLQV